MKTQSWYAHGKLLITGEYLVLEGAKALAIPLKPGQYLSVKKQKEKKLFWTAMKTDGLWFQTVMQLPGLDVIQTTDDGLAGKLQSILCQTQSLNPNFLSEDKGYSVETILEFNPEFGFGSSSTLISNLAKWADVDPYELQKSTFGGSGYDIACATIKEPIIYQLRDSKPTIEYVNLDFRFTDQIYFVYLGKKQRSTESIHSFKNKSKFSRHDLDQINMITKEILFCNTIAEFEELLSAHEHLLSKILNTEKVQTRLFPDHAGIVKSLGGWGGDFVLMTSHSERNDFEKYLKQKGFNIFYTYDELVLK